jgi:hypothetical protein
VTETIINVHSLVCNVSIVTVREFKIESAKSGVVSVAMKQRVQYVREREKEYERRRYVIANQIKRFECIE